MRIETLELLSYLCNRPPGAAVVFLAKDRLPEYCESLSITCRALFRCSEVDVKPCGDLQTLSFDRPWNTEVYWSESAATDMPDLTGASVVICGPFAWLPAAAMNFLREKRCYEVIFVSFGEWRRRELTTGAHVVERVRSAVSGSLNALSLVAAKVRRAGQKAFLKAFGKNLHEAGVTHFSHDGGHLYKAFVPHLREYSDRYNRHDSSLHLFEETEWLIPHQSHQAIRTLGRGRFAHWENDIYLSSTDHSNPNQNGRRYRYVLCSGPSLVLNPLVRALFPARDIGPALSADDTLYTHGARSGFFTGGTGRRLVRSLPRIKSFESEVARLMASDSPRGMQLIGGDRGEVDMIIGSLAPGGSERQLTYVTRGLRAMGIPVRVYTNDEKGPQFQHYLPAIQACGAVHEIYSQPHPDFDTRWLISAAGLRDLEIIEKIPEEYGREVWNIYTHLMVNRPKVLHCWLDHTNIVGGIAGWLAGVPRIVISTRNVNPSHFPYLFKDWYHAWYKRLAGCPRVRFIANSRVGAKSYADWMNVPTFKFSVVHNGIDLDVIENADAEERASFRRSVGVSADAPLIAGVFRLSFEKEPFTFLKVIAKLARDLPALRAVIAGIGPMEKDVAAEIEKLGLGERVKLLGRREDVPTIMSASDLVMLTSSHEGLPNVLMEAQSLGRPVVCTDAGGIPEVVKDGVTGFVHRVGDVDGLAEACRQLLSDRSLRDRMGAAAKIWIREEMSSALMVERTLKAYDLKSQEIAEMRSEHSAGAIAAPAAMPTSNLENTAELWTSANPFERKLQEAVEFDIRNARSQLNFLPGGSQYARSRTCLEVGPGQDIGIPLLIMGFGARAYVVDKYLCPWDDAYHPKFYRELREQAKIHFPEADLKALDEVIENNDHKAEGLIVLRLGLEEVGEAIPDNSIDWSFSNATFEHLFDARAALLQLGRITKPEGLGFHQTDFRDHRNFSVPLEYITMPADEFKVMMHSLDCSCGNRLRYTDFLPWFEEAGFEVKLTPSLYADEDYLEDVLRRAQPEYRQMAIEALKVLSGRFHLVKRQSKVVQVAA